MQERKCRLYANHLFLTDFKLDVPDKHDVFSEENRLSLSFLEENQFFFSQNNSSDYHEILKRNTFSFHYQLFVYSY